MDWLKVAEDYAGSFGWGGASMKPYHVSRIMTNEDIPQLVQKMVVSTRSRGVLSGFLVIVPNLDSVVFLPPFRSKLKPSRIRLRISDTIRTQGCVLSAYMENKQLVLEDVLVWNNENIWLTKAFSERRSALNEFVRGFRQDSELQGITVQVSELRSVTDIIDSVPAEGQCFEFIPEKAGQRRLLYLVEVKPEIVSTEPVVAKREQIIGPDIYSVWRGEERLGLGMVRTLAISRALRLRSAPTIPVNVSWNKQFDKWEILSVA